MTSSSKKPKYWMSPAELAPPLPAPKEVGEEATRETGTWGRRTFLKATGFSAMGAFLAACSPGPVKKAIPYLVPPEEIVPGKAYFYASTCGSCTAGCGLMAKNRDGRPIKLEGFRGGNGPIDRAHPISGGGLCAAGQAGLLGLYDSKRFPAPKNRNNTLTWNALDAEVKAKLDAAQGAVVVLTSTVTSPSTQARIDAFLEKGANRRHIQYDAMSSSALLDAHEVAFGSRVLPRFAFDKAQVIVSFDADFLGTWISPVEFSDGYAKGRNPSAKDLHMSWHAQVESGMSLTGSKADRRLVATHVQAFEILKDLAFEISKRSGKAIVGLDSGKSKRPDDVKLLADRLWEAKGKSLLVSGSNRLEAQMLVARINDLLGNYGKTLDIASPSFQRKGRDQDVGALVADMNAGKVSAIIIQGVNPVFDRPDAQAFADGLDKVDCVICVDGSPTETTAKANYICPQPHFLESWDDAVSVHGVLSLTQPAIRPLFDTRHFRDSLAAWTGDTTDDRAFRKKLFKDSLPWKKTGAKSFTAFWDQTQHDGAVALAMPSLAYSPWQKNAFDKLVFQTASEFPNALEVSIHADTGMWDGRFGHNAWLQELPDPITKMSWGNAASLSPGTAQQLNLSDGDEIEVMAQDFKVKLPVRIQPGQHADAVVIPMGYGRAGTDRFSKVGPQWLEGDLTVKPGDVIGVNVAPMNPIVDGRVQNHVTVTIKKTGAKPGLALAQTYGSLDLPEKTAPPGHEHRDIVKETTLVALGKHASDHKGGHHSSRDLDLWDNDHANDKPHWGMAIDLTKCTGCSACVLACQVENNIPVVGRDEVERRREMHWLRIDRYFSGPIHEPEEIDTVHQPMMCQQCDNAPCETVCPVLATVHSEEGLNQQVYNRCIGTRYCANNCPYKVRRFNWFDYSHEDRLQNMALNPDVVTRSRGVMEKCSFCVQRIQSAKADAKREGRPLTDGEIEPACMQTCPTTAIVFGNTKDHKSQVAEAMADPLEFLVLEELNVKPTVAYRTIVRNHDEEEGGRHG